MVRKSLSVFLAIFAISFGISSAQSCSDLDTCTKCLGKSGTATGCAWHVGPSLAGCIDVNKCGSEEYEDGECFSGKDGCKKTCSTQAGDCEDCLGYDATGKGGKRGDCAWFIRDGDEPQCIFHKRCNDKGFENGTCTRGKKGGNNKKKCKAPTSCDDITDCKDCLDSVNPFCAWAVHERIMDGKSTRCVDEARCDDDFKDDWSCYKGSIITNPKKVCKRIKNKPRDQLCSNLSGFCSDCLKYDCSWNRDNKKCYDTCKDAPKGANCEPPPPNPQITTSNELVDGNGRSLLRFDSEESMLCFNWQYDDENKELCRKAGKNSECEPCASTFQIIPPGIFFVKAPTCFHLPQTGECVAKCPGDQPCLDICPSDDR